MATSTFYFSGEAEWAKVVTPDADYDKTKSSWKLNLIFDAKSLELFEKSQLALKLKKKEDGRYYTCFRRPTKSVMRGEVVEFSPPILLKADNSPRSSEPINNGSQVTIKVVVYDSMRGKGHRLEAVRVDQEGSAAQASVSAPDDTIPF